MKTCSQIAFERDVLLKSRHWSAAFVSWGDNKGQTGKSLVQKAQAKYSCPAAKCNVSYSKVLLMTSAPKVMDDFLPAWAVTLIKDVISSYKLCLI